MPANRPASFINIKGSERHPASTFGCIIPSHLRDRRIWRTAACLTAAPSSRPGSRHLATTSQTSASPASFQQQTYSFSGACIQHFHVQASSLCTAQAKWNGSSGSDAWPHIKNGAFKGIQEHGRT
jgi:hypothetical protein